MSPQRTFLSILLIAVVVALCGCAEETAELKQKIAELEKKMQKQEKDLREFAGKFSPPRDFSADIQRIEDQQERISKALKTKLDPVDSKLAELQDWVQGAQNERENVSKKLKSLEQVAAEAQKKGDIEARLRQEILVTKKSLTVVSKSVEDLTKNVAEIRKEALDNNAKIVTAVKNTLPKVKEMAVAELKNQITPLEQSLANLKATTDNDRKTQAGLKPPQPQPATPESGRETQIMAKRIKDLEEVVTMQKSYLLELGAKVHELEQVLRKYTN